MGPASMLGFLVAGFGLGILAVIRMVAEAFYVAGVAFGVSAGLGAVVVSGSSVLARVVQGRST